MSTTTESSVDPVDPVEHYVVFLGDAEQVLRDEVLARLSTGELEMLSRQLDIEARLADEAKLGWIGDIPGCRATDQLRHKAGVRADTIRKKAQAVTALLQEKLAGVPFIPGANRVPTYETIGAVSSNERIARESRGLIEAALRG